MADTIRIQTAVAGEREVPRSDVFEIVQPLLGFEHTGAYTIIRTNDSPLAWLQAIDQVDQCFCVMDPFAAGWDPDPRRAPAKWR